MIVLDTNVLAELMKPNPAVAVLTWIDNIPTAEFATTAITAAELRTGVRLLPTGRRREALQARVDELLTETFRGTVYPFDIDSAEWCAEIIENCTRLGRPIGMTDAQIAAICRQRGTQLATRNIKDFRDAGVVLIDPWA
jgi:predicted nucleic acid-binding protein